jgi:uncharacterized repeat protein (TIGR03803 family)
VNGTLYGTTTGGGAHNNGTVFSITPGGTEKVLYSFGISADGVDPRAGLIDVKGTLYGTTYQGGAYNRGTVFSITPGGKEKVLHSFNPNGSSKDGANPVGGLTAIKQTLYGTTEYGGLTSSCVTRVGCGTVFSITPSGKETVLYSFGSGSDAYPMATLLNVNGTLYGTAWFGGAYGRGTVFSITLSGHETILYSFKYGGDGGYPDSGLSYVNGTFYGTTTKGGAYYNGTVYSITP